jgi:hypothetical protein
MMSNQPGQTQGMGHGMMPGMGAGQKPTGPAEAKPAQPQPEHEQHHPDAK